VPSGAGIVTTYRLTWLVLLALVVAATVWLALGRRIVPVPANEVRPTIAAQEEPQQEYRQEPFADLIIEMNEIELSLSSREGSLKLRVWAREAEKNETGYAISDGVLQFAMEERSTLLLHVQDASLATATDTVELSGSLVGHVMDGSQTGEVQPDADDTGGDQYFEATRLTWNMNESVIRSDKVVYRAPSIDVSGERMILDLATGGIEFEGKVEAGV
jgi:hypothetical protein